MKGHLMRVDKGSKRIMNLDPISIFRETGALNVEVGGSDKQKENDLELDFSDNSCNSL